MKRRYNQSELRRRERNSFHVVSRRRWLCQDLPGSMQHLSNSIRIDG
jgi:hypothetical protein